MTWHVHCHVTCVILDSGHIWPQEEPSAYLHLPWSLSQGRRRQTASFHWERLGTKVVLCAQDCQGVMVTWPPYHHHRHHHHHHHDHIVMISQHYHPTGWRSADEGAALSPNNPSGCERCFAGRYCFTAAGLFLALACVEDKQLPANEVSQDRSPMRLAEGSTDHGGFGWWFRMIVEGVETCWNHKKVKECSTSCSAWPENGPALESTYPFMRWPMALPLVSVSSTDLFIRKTRLFIALVISKSCHVRSLLGMIIQVCIYIYI